MARDINAVQVRFNPTQLNPTGGLAIAQKSAANISNAIAQQQELEQNQQKIDGINSYRNQVASLAREKFQYEKDAPVRAEEEADKQLLLSNARGVESQRIANDPANAWSLKDSFMSNPNVQEQLANLPGYQEMNQPVGGGPQQPGVLSQEVQDYNKAFFNSNVNKRLFSDASTYRNNVLSDALSAKKADGTPMFNQKQAEAEATKATNALFPTMSEDIVGKLWQDAKGTGNINGIGGYKNGNRKGSFTKGVTAEMTDMVNSITEQRGLDKLPSEFLWTDLRYDIFKTDPASSDIANTLGKLVADGITDTQILKSSIDSAFSPEGNTLSSDLDFTTKAGYEKLLDNARQSQAASKAQNGNGGILGSTNAQRRADNNNLLGRMNPNQTSAQKRLEAYVAGLPKGTPKPELTLDSTINTDGMKNTNSKPRAKPTSILNTDTPEVKSILGKSVNDIKSNDSNYVSSGRSKILNKSSRNAIKAIQNKESKQFVNSIIEQYDNDPSSISVSMLNDAINKIDEGKGFSLRVSNDKKRLMAMRAKLRRSQ